VVRLQAEILKINTETPEPSLVSYAAEQIKRGRVAGMPTDTFYALAADPYNLRAVDRIYEMKQRDRRKPLSLLIESVEQAELLAAHLPDEFHLLADKFWPGPLTIIVPASPRLPLRSTANTGNVALRIPQASIPLAILRAAGLPLTATSANLHGAAECATATEVKAQFEGKLSLIVDGGDSPRAVLSTIVNLADPCGRWKLQREGAISLQQIEDILGDQ
jgi:tRNA threonylcarbamoyl adenosine modification protein (Sua5/YciO/YrdC/YwlC family)